MTEVSSMHNVHMKLLDLDYTRLDNAFSHVIKPKTYIVLHNSLVQEIKLTNAENTK